MPESLVEHRLTLNLAVRMLDAWFTELQQGEARTVAGGQIKLDSVPSPDHAPRGSHTDHAMDGSTAIVYYLAGNRPTPRAIREAQEWCEVMRLPRTLYIGKLIDIKRGGNGTYFKLRTMTRRSERDNTAGYRTFNPRVGRVIAMIVNPFEDTLAQELSTAREQGRDADARLIEQVAQVEGHALRREAE
jgi:hypothetical protein